jgi:UDP-N-acetylmuramoylalanine--D-glutamate ligase
MVALGVEEATDDDALARAAEGFTPLASRLTEIGTVHGVTFVDDSLSTNAMAAMAALDTFAGRPVALIVGGADRGIDYTPLAAQIAARREPTFVVTLPANGARIHAAVLEHTGGTSRPEIHDTGDLETAVDRAFAWSEPGTVILLSPAAASFGQFKNYRERAAAFRQAMETHQGGPEAALGETST